MAITQNDSQFDSTLIGASPDDALNALTKAGESATQLIEAWVAQSNAGAVAAAAEHATGTVRKAARRGLNILKSRGVTIPIRGRVSTVAQLASVPTIRAWVACSLGHASGRKRGCGRSSRSPHADPPL